MSINTLLAAWDAGQTVSLPWIDAGPSEAQGVYIFALELLRLGRDQTAPPDRIEIKALRLLEKCCPLTPQQISQGRTLANVLRQRRPLESWKLVTVQRTFPSPPPPPPREARAALVPGTDFPRRVKAAIRAGGYIGEALGE